MRPVFITGTDTGVGKSFVGGGICHLARHAKLRVGVMKPVETGCTEHRGKLLPADAALLSTCAHDGETSLDEICPYRFAPPISPETAARQAGVAIDFKVIRRHCENLAKGKDLMLVEGAGGLLVPLTEKKNMADLAKFLKARVLLVVGSKLGCLNHALLTLSELARRKLPVVGVVFNQVVAPGGEDRSLTTNQEDLERHTRRIKVPIFGTLPYLENGPQLLKPFAYRTLFEKHLDHERLLAALQR